LVPLTVMLTFIECLPRIAHDLACDEVHSPNPAVAVLSNEGRFV
jgi:hypothetical protein